MAEKIMIHRLQISGPAGTSTYEIPMGTAVLGRRDADLVLDDQLVSRRHAQIVCADDGCTITDTKSSNGTKVNGIRLKEHDPHPLNPGDVIEIGAFTLTYEMEEVVTAVAAPIPEPTPAPISESDVVDAERPSTQLAPEAAVSEAVVSEAVVSEAAAAEAAVAEVKPSPPKPSRKSRAETKINGGPPQDQPPVPPALSPVPEPEGEPAYTPPPGLSLTESRYLQYLPGIYHTSFMKRFLALFESIYAPIEWTVDNFDVFLHPATAPADFLPWLANWFDLTFDQSWDEAKRRAILTEAHQIYARRGTRWALSRVLEIYTGLTPDIDDASEALEPFTFTVMLPVPESEVNGALIARLINAHKPAHTSYTLRFK
ncbi:MAG TPA: phage tail protein I [Chloroflexota bacterium]|nr:phage tail protein I [Chloroflexota bacterium]